MFSALFGSSQEEPEKPIRKSQPPQQFQQQQQMYPNVPPSQYSSSHRIQSRPPPPPHRHPNGTVNHHARHDSHYQPTSYRPVNRLRSDEPTTRYPGSQLSKIRIVAGGANLNDDSLFSMDPALLEVPPTIPKMYFQYEEQVIQDALHVRRMDEERRLEWEDRRRIRAEAEEQKLNASAVLSSLTTPFGTSFQPQPRKKSSISNSVSNVFSGLRQKKSPPKKGESVDEYGVVPSSVVQEDSDDGQDAVSREGEGEEQKEKSNESSTGQQSSWLSSFLPTSLSGGDDVYNRLRISSQPRSPPKESSNKSDENVQVVEGEGEGEGERGGEQESQPESPVDDGLSKPQRRRLKEFCRQTQADESTGLAYLMQYDWDLELCIARFYADNPDLKGRGANVKKEENSTDYVSQAKEMSSSALLAATDLSQRLLSSWRGKGENKDHS